VTAPKKLTPFGQNLLAFVRATPLSRGRLRRLMLKIVKKRIDYPVLTNFKGVPFIFNMDNPTEEKALFGHYNIEELEFLQRNAKQKCAVFVDLGGNSGFFTQIFLARNESGLALTVEPNPQMCDRIEANYSLLPADKRGKLVLERMAVGNMKGETELDLSNGFGSASIVGDKGASTISVSIGLLADILQKHEIEKIDVLKIDIEGHEDKALIPFFENSAKSLFPKHLILEHTSSKDWDDDLFSVLKDVGYREVGKTRGNVLMSLT
jgi:FkbM family methyltransferase